MDFAFTEDQISVRDLAEKIFRDRVQDNYWSDTFNEAEPFDKALWATLVETGMTGIALPAAYGGSEMGFIELCLLLEAQTQFLAPVPLFAANILSGLPIAEFGTEDQKSAYLCGITDGSKLVTAAVGDMFLSGAEAIVFAEETHEGWELNGALDNVAYGVEADAVLIPAHTKNGISIFIVSSEAEGFLFELQEGMSCDPLARLTLKNVKTAARDILGDLDGGDDILFWMRPRVLTALAAMQLGVAREALKRTADYVSERHQFGRAVGSFQSVAHRAADAYIDIEAMNATLWQSVWTIDQEIENPHAVETARWWACEGGHRVAHAAQHLHGGIGADLEFPIHRYFLAAKQLEYAADGARPTLATLGGIIQLNTKEIQS